MNGPPRFVLVAEDRAHAWLAITLADRLAAQEIGWLNEHQDLENKLLPDWARTFAPKNLKLALRVNQDALPEQTIEYYIDKHDIPKLYKNAGVPLVNRPGATPLTRKTVRALRYFKEIEADAGPQACPFSKSLAHRQSDTQGPPKPACARLNGF